MGGWTPLDAEDGLDGIHVGGVGSETVNSLCGKGDQAALSEQISGVAEKSGGNHGRIILERENTLEEYSSSYGR